PSDRDGWGSDVILRIKDREPEDDASAGRDYLSVWTLREIIKKYSDFVSYPIYLEDFSDKKDDDKKPEPVNSMKAIWIRPESEVQGEEYREFYRHISHDWEEPMERIVYRAEGKSEFHALLFIPSRPPFDLFYRDGTHGIQLYIRRVFIMNDCKDVIPEYMRFLKGVVDSEDLPLNISREILQQDRQTAMIKRGVVRKVLDSLKKMKSDRPEDFAKFWSMFGEVVKEGIVSDPKNRDAILKLALFSGSKSGRTSLEDYAAKMADGQKSIYYLTGGRGETLSASPKLEAFTDRGIDVLLLNDPIDEIWLSSFHEFDSHPFVSVSAENVEIEGSPEDPSAEIADSFLSGLKEAVKSLGLDSVEDVKLSARLVDSPATFVQKGEGVSAQMRNFFKAMGQEAPPERKVLEINASHPLVRKMTEAELDDGGRRDMAVLLTGLASISDGEPVADARRFTKTLERLLEK
ncbi:MAG: molecular chaperone HtpG, partial [Synergistaceae bacterium]|nr:molecular chaperone HtpG [Synergistaceae bacterium]